MSAKWRTGNSAWASSSWRSRRPRCRSTGPVARHHQAEHAVLVQILRVLAIEDGEMHAFEAHQPPPCPDPQIAIGGLREGLSRLFGQSVRRLPHVARVPLKPFGLQCGASGRASQQPAAKCAECLHGGAQYIVNQREAVSPALRISRQSDFRRICKCMQKSRVIFVHGCCGKPRLRKKQLARSLSSCLPLDNR